MIKLLILKEWCCHSKRKHCMHLCQFIFEKNEVRPQRQRVLTLAWRRTRSKCGCSKSWYISLTQLVFHITLALYHFQNWDSLLQSTRRPKLTICIIQVIINISDLILCLDFRITRSQCWPLVQKIIPINNTIL